MYEKKTPEEQEKYNQFQAFKRGFRDGVNATAKREAFAKYDQYDVGYNQGRRAYDVVMTAWLKLHNMKPPSILRDASLADDVETIDVEPMPAGVRTIVLNGEQRYVSLINATYDQVVEWVYGKSSPGVSVTFRGRQGQEGILSPGQSVPLADGMVFNAIRTNNA